ncbi:MAG: hypothetical protein K2R98_17560 [Gemmataceae bacterium]|nr:hypothetical protein [Gemmataceae bacterium]
MDRINWSVSLGRLGDRLHIRLLPSESLAAHGEALARETLDSSIKASIEQDGELLGVRDLLGRLETARRELRAVERIRDQAKLDLGAAEDSTAATLDDITAKRQALQEADVKLAAARESFASVFHRAAGSREEMKKIGPVNLADRVEGPLYRQLREGSTGAFREIIAALQGLVQSPALARMVLHAIAAEHLPSILHQRCYARVQDLLGPEPQPHQAPPSAGEQAIDRVLGEMAKAGLPDYERPAPPPPVEPPPSPERERAVMAALVRSALDGEGNLVTRQLTRQQEQVDPEFAAALHAERTKRLTARGLEVGLHA